jgi:hypothetical protein
MFTQDSRPKTHSPIAFFALAYGISWMHWVPMALASQVSWPKIPVRTKKSQSGRILLSGYAEKPTRSL